MREVQVGKFLRWTQVRSIEVSIAASPAPWWADAKAFGMIERFARTDPTGIDPSVTAY
jgi:hypothetical protein